LGLLGGGIVADVDDILDSLPDNKKSQASAQDVLDSLPSYSAPYSGYLDAAWRNAKAGFGSVYGGIGRYAEVHAPEVANLVQDLNAAGLAYNNPIANSDKITQIVSTSPTDSDINAVKNVAKSVGDWGTDVADSNIPKDAKQYGDWDWLPFMSDYWTNPAGAAAATGQGVGSSAALIPIGLAIAPLLPEELPAAGAGLLGKGLTNIGLNKLGQKVASEAGQNMLKWGTAGAISKIPEAVSEGGNIVDDLRKQGYSDEQIKGIADKVVGKNIPLLMAEGALELTGLTGKLGKAVLSPTDSTLKSIGKNIVLNTATGMPTEWYTEGAQQAIQNEATGQRAPSGLGFANPLTWGPDEFGAAGAGAVSALGLGGIGGAYAGVVNKVVKAAEANNSKKVLDALPEAITTEQPEESAQNGSDLTPSVTEAAAPANNFETLVNAISGQESGGNYDAVNSRTGAAGKFQIMPGNWASWAQDAGLSPDAPMTAENQELVAKNKLRQYYDKYGARGAAIAWYGGEGALDYSDEAKNRKQGNGDEPSINEYADSIMSRMGNQGGSATGALDDIGDIKINTDDLTSIQLSDIKTWAEEKAETATDEKEINFLNEAVDNGRIKDIVEKYPVQIADLLRGDKATESAVDGEKTSTNAITPTSKENPATANPEQGDQSNSSDLIVQARNVAGTGDYTQAASLATQAGDNVLAEAYLLMAERYNNTTGNEATKTQVNPIPSIDNKPIGRPAITGNADVVRSDDGEEFPTRLEDNQAQVNKSNVQIIDNTEKNGIELKFDGKPNDEIRDKLKANGFRWNRGKKVWYARKSDKAVSVVNEIASLGLTNEQPQEQRDAGEPSTVDLLKMIQNGSFTPREFANQYGENAFNRLRQSKYIAAPGGKLILSDAGRQFVDVVGKATNKSSNEIEAENSPKNDYNEGDRVTWQDHNGNQLTGAVRSIDNNNGQPYMMVNTDQIATYGGGVPIGRIEMVRLSDKSLSKIEKPADEEQTKPDTNVDKQDGKINVTQLKLEEKPQQTELRRLPDQHQQSSQEKVASNPDANLTEYQQAVVKVADWVKVRLSVGEKFISQELFAIADKAFNGTQSNGKYTPKDAYDAMELGINKYLLEQGYVDPSKAHNAEEAIKAVEKIKKDILDKIPTQTKRTAEMDEFQQFSTPPTLAYVAAWVSNVSSNDIVLEPSAGIGGIATFAKLAGAKVNVNEYSDRRASIIKQLGFDKVFTENAEQLNNILPEDVKPTLVLMNPPFSSTAGRMQGKRQTKNATLHIEQALQRLEPGGRLVAIVGKGMADNAPSFKNWWKKIKSEYNVRANVGIDGQNYTKYGTSFDNNLFVIDKTGPTENTITGNFTGLDEVLTALEGVRDEFKGTRESNAIAQSVTTQPNSKVTTSESQSKARSDGRTGGIERVPANGLGVGNGRGTSEETGGYEQSARNGRKDNASSESSEINGLSNESGRGRRGEYDDQKLHENQQSGGSSGIFDTNVKTETGLSSGLKVEQIDNHNDSNKELTDSTFNDYQPQKLKILGAKPHPSPLVQSAAMAAVEPPAPTYSPKLPKEIISKGKLSIAQLEPVVYAGQSFEQTLPNDTRKGYFIGDGTGVGKGREISGIIMDSLNSGKKKAVWVSKNDPLFDDAVRDWTDIGGNSDQIFPIRKIKAGMDIPTRDGILFITYPTLANNLEANGNGEGVKEKVGKSSRLRQIVNWLGKDFDGVIAFDEAHMMANCLPMKGKRGNKKPSAQGLAGVEFQKRLPNARIIYVSATGATEVSNLGYATRLGLWGEGTAFSDVNDFVSQINSSGLAAMELIARDMKALGVYLARNLSYDGVTYGTLVHDLTTEQREIYDTMAQGWQIVLQNIHEALKTTGAISEDGKTKNPNAKKNALGQFWGSQQRFFNQILTSMQMPAVIDDVRKQIKAGNSIVMQLVNTNEAIQNRSLSNMEEDTALEDLDMTPRDILMQFLDKSFPVAQYEEFIDDEGNKRSRPVKDSQGNPVLNQAAVSMKEDLMNRLGSMKVPEGPLELIINTFGTKTVAEVTGRQRRVVREKDDSGHSVSKIEKRSKSHNKADVKAFLDDKKAILIFSEAGGTGQSFHAGANMKNQRRRIHYLIQPGWRADSAVQGFGRTHRSGEVSQPHYVLVTTNLKGQKRFISTIARRLDQLGALTKGQRDAANQGLFSAKDNLESEYAKDALQRFYENLMHNVYKDLNIHQLLIKMGLESLENNDDNINKRNVNVETMRDVPKFLNRILTLDSNEQNQVFDYFIDILDQIIDTHVANGTLDTGMETLRADGVQVKDEKTVYSSDSNNAETKYVELEAKYKNEFFSYEKAIRLRNFIGFYKNEKSGKIWAVRQGASRTNERGAVTNTYVLQSPSLNRYRSIDEQEFKRDGWKQLKEDQGKELWEQALLEEPKYRNETLHMITGAILPIWDRLPQGQARVIRVQADDGRVFLGRIIKERDIAATLKRLGTSKKYNFSTDDIKNKILNENNEVELANGWKLDRRRVSGENRIEIIGDNLWKYDSQFQEHGIIRERIQYNTRYFLPTGEEFKPSYEWLTKDRQVTDVVAPERSSSNKFNSGLDPTFGKLDNIDLAGEIKKAAGNIQDAMPGLIELGKRLVAEGYNKSGEWAKKMREYLGDVWGKVKNKIVDVWKQVKDTVANERGSFRLGTEATAADEEADNSISTKQVDTVDSSDIAEVNEKATLKLAQKMGIKPADNVAIRNKSTSNKIGLFSNALQSVNELVRQHQKLKPFFRLATIAMEKQESLRNEFRHRMDKWEYVLGRRELLKYKRLKNEPDYKENKLNLYKILLQGDIDGKDYTNNELREAGYSDKVIKAYRMVRVAMDKAYTLANDIRQGLEIKSENLNSYQLAKLKENRFITILKETPSNGDLTLVSYKTPKIREDTAVMSKQNFAEMRDNPNVQILSANPYGVTEHAMPESSGLTRGDGFYEVHYMSQTPPINKLGGYIPHFFHDWFIMKKITDGETGKTTYKMLDSGNTMREAIQKANKIAAANPDMDIVIQPKQFKFPGEEMQAAVVGDYQYFKMQQKIAEDLQISLFDAKQFMDGKVSMKGRHRFMGNFLQRKGAEGYEKNLDWVLSHYFNMVGRYVAMDPFKSKAISTYERLFGRWDSASHEGEGAYVKDYINDVNGVPTNIEKALNDALDLNPIFKKYLSAYLGDRPALQLVSGLTNTITGLKLGMLNVSSALLQFAQFSNIGAILNDYGAASNGLTRSIRPNLADRIILRKAGVDTNLTLASGSYSRASNMGKLFKNSTILFNYLDMLMRRAAILGAYHKSISEGKSEEEAMQYAKFVNTKANFDYSVADSPNLFRRGGPAAQLLLQFKKFGLKEVELMGDLLREGSVGQNLRLWVPLLLLSGLFAGPPFLNTFIELLSGISGVDFEEKIKKVMFAWAGEDKLRLNLVKAATYGVFATEYTGGVDISNRTGLADILPTELKDALGPTIGTFISVIREASKGNVNETLKAISPGVGNIAQAITGESKTTRGRINNVYDTMYERVAKGLGFRLTDEAVASDLRNIISTEQKEKQAEDAEAIDSYIDNPSDKNRGKLVERSISGKRVNAEMQKKSKTGLERSLQNISKGQRGEYEYMMLP